MITGKEVFEGVAFLARYAPREYRIFLDACLERMQIYQEQRAAGGYKSRLIDDLDISVRLANLLQSAGCLTVADTEALIRKPEVWKKSRKSERELRSVLEALKKTK